MGLYLCTQTEALSGDGWEHKLPLLTQTGALILILAMIVRAFPNTTGGMAAIRGSSDPTTSLTPEEHIRLWGGV
ncbi:MAG: hypothetical protein C4337_07920 [Armatimonadota bacterium]